MVTYLGVCALSGELKGLMNLIANKNDNISLKSKKEYKNIQEMIDDYEIKKEKEKINKKYI